MNPLNHLITLGAGEVLNQLSAWLVDGAHDVATAAMQAAFGSTTPSFDKSWFVGSYETMITIAVALALPLLLACALSAIVHQDAGRLLRAVVIHLPLAAVATFVALGVVGQLVNLVDELSGYVGPSMQSVLGIGQSITGVKGAAAMFVAGLLAIGALVLWLELALRQAAIYATVLLLPLFLAGLLWPGTVKVAKRAVETLVVLILSKFVIAAVLALGLHALDVQHLDPSLTALQPLMAGAALTLFASLAPWVLLRLVPVVETAAAAHLEGLSRRSLSATQIPAALHQTPYLITDAIRQSASRPATSSAVSALAMQPASTDERLDTTPKPPLPQPDRRAADGG